MDRTRIGELLNQMGKLSPLDIDEILQEQHVSKMRFGTIALASGYCQPEDIWQAWCGQLSHHLQTIDLPSFGVDAQATAYVPREIAARLGLMPVRVVENELVVAVSEAATVTQATELLSDLGMRIRFSLAPAGQIAAAIDNYYPPSRVAG